MYENWLYAREIIVTPIRVFQWWWGFVLRNADRLYPRQEFLDVTLSLPILTEFRHWLDDRDALPSSLLGEAITYTVNQWESLCLYTRDGQIPIDTHRA